MKHLDLFSGIGGFALACEWAGIETVCFCEIDDFCCKVLNKHWPNVPIVKDVNDVEGIKRITTHSSESRARKNLSGIRQGIGGIDRGQEPASPHARCLRQEECQEQTAGLEQCDEAITNTTSKRGERWGNGSRDSTRAETRLSGCNDSFLLTAGFPCQPFSNAGRKRGASDDRYLWPQTLAVIKAVKPNWIILENVAGILNMVFPDSAVGVASQASFCKVPNDEIADYNTISGGIDSDLREAGYETVWLVIPACSLGAPHRRDRVWIIANAITAGTRYNNREACDERGRASQDWRESIRQAHGEACTSGINSADKHGITSNANRTGHGTSTSGTIPNGQTINEGQDGQPQSEHIRQDSHASNTSIKGLQGEQSRESLRLSGQPCGKWSDQRPDWRENWYEVATRFCRVDARIPDRVDRLKALGNAIVPQVAYQIIVAIKQVMNMEGI